MPLRLVKFVWSVGINKLMACQIWWSFLVQTDGGTWVRVRGSLGTKLASLSSQHRHVVAKAILRCMEPPDASLPALSAFVCKARPRHTDLHRSARAAERAWRDRATGGLLACSATPLTEFARVIPGWLGQVFALELGRI